MLIAAHGNSLRALVMKLERLTPEEILEVNIPTGVPLAYTLDADLNVRSKRYLGDPDAVAAKMAAVANQGRARGLSCAPPRPYTLTARVGPASPRADVL